MLRPAADASQADWLLPRLPNQPRVVQSYVSVGFAAYARVLNPANGFDGGPVRWAKIAGEVGVELTAQTQWSELAADLRDEGELINLGAPDLTPDPGMARVLTSVLASFTATPEDCYFLLWEGYAGVDDYFGGLGAPKLAMFENRQLFLLSGALENACEPFLEDGRRLPNWWWPQGREWCAGNEIYTRSLLVGGSEECIAAVVAHPGLEAFAISPYSPAYEELE